MQPFKVIQEGIKVVQPVKYALGIAGVGAAFALILTFFSNKQEAIIGIIVMITLMILLLIFASATALSRNYMKYPALIMTWFILLSYFAVSGLIISSVFFDKPKSFINLVEDFTLKKRIEPSSMSQTTLEDSTQRLTSSS